MSQAATGNRGETESAIDERNTEMKHLWEMVEILSHKITKLYEIIVRLEDRIERLEVDVDIAMHYIP